MAEASQNKEVLINDFSPGWIIKRGTAAVPNGPIQLRNATVEADGSIYSRSGYIRINKQPFSDGTGALNATVVHSTFLFGSTRYVGVGSVIKRNMDPGVTIVSGLTGARITATAMSPSPATPELWTYFANGNFTTHGGAGDCRKKDNGIVTRNWGIDGPKAAPVATLDEEQPAHIVIDDFESAYSPQDAIGTTGGALNPYDSGAQAFTVPQRKTERYKRTNAINLARYDDEAHIRMMIRVSRVESLEHVELAFDVSASGDFTKDFYHVKIPASIFRSDNVWQDVRIRKRQFDRVTPKGGSERNWSNVSAVLITVAAAEGDTGTSVVVSFDDMRMEYATHPDGPLEYRHTWWNNDAKIRSNSRSIDDVYAVRDLTSKIVQANKQRVQVTRSTAPSDAQVTHWELWRRNREGVGIFQFVARIPIGQSTFFDTYADDELGEELLDNNHIPPPARFCFSYDDRMFLCGLIPQAFLGESIYEGKGPNNMHTKGHYDGPTASLKKYIVEITSEDADPNVANSFKWSDNGGASFFTGAIVTGVDQTLSNGVLIYFDTLGQHKIGDRWTFEVVPTGEEQAPYAVRFSERFRPESFPLTNYFLAGDPVDTIRGHAVWQAQAWMFTKEHIYRVVPTTGPTGRGSYIAQVTEAPVGTESPYAVSPSPYGIFHYVQKDGPYLFNGSTSVPISSQQIQPFFEGETFTTDGINVSVAVPVFISDYVNVVGQYHNRFYYLVVDDSEGECCTLVYNAETPRWHRLGGRDITFQRLNSENAGNDIVPARNLEAGNSTGWLILIDPNVNNPLDHDGEAVEVVVQQTFDVIMKPQDVEVDIKDIAVDLNTAGQPALVEASFDDQPLQVMGIASAVGRQKVFLPVPGSTGEEGQGRICYKVSVRILILQRTARVNIFGIGVGYWPEPRKSTIHSAMWFAPKEKGWARRGRFVMRSVTPVEMRLWFDEERTYVTTLPSTQNRRLGMDPTVPTALHGKVARIIFTSDQPFVIYPQSYFEMYPFGEPTRLIPWQLTP